LLRSRTFTDIGVRAPVDLPETGVRGLDRQQTPEEFKVNESAVFDTLCA